MKITNAENLQIAQIQAVKASQDSALSASSEGGKGQKDLQQVKKLAKDFEAIFTGIMLKSMRASIQKSGLMDGGNAEDIYRGMLDQEYSKSMASQSNSDLAKSIEEYLIEAAGLKDQSKSKTAQALKAYGAEGLHPVSKKATLVSKTSLHAPK